MKKKKRIQLTKDLWLDEYIPRELYLKLERKPHILIGLLDKRLIEADQLLRSKFGVVIINNWWELSDREFEIEISKPPEDRWVRFGSGLRLFGTETGATLSQHFYGRASDKIFRDVTAQEVREYIKGVYEELEITCIEENISWVHSDHRWIRNNELLIIYP